MDLNRRLVVAQETPMATKANFVLLSKENCDWNRSSSPVAYWVTVVSSCGRQVLKWLRTSSKFSGQEFEEIHRNIGSLETSKQVRIPPSTK